MPKSKKPRNIRIGIVGGGTGYVLYRNNLLKYYQKKSKNGLKRLHIRGIAKNYFPGIAGPYDPDQRASSSLLRAQIDLDNYSTLCQINKSSGAINRWAKEYLTPFISSSIAKTLKSTPAQFPMVTPLMNLRKDELNAVSLKKDEEITEEYELTFETFMEFLSSASPKNASTGEYSGRHYFGLFQGHISREVGARLCELDVSDTYMPGEVQVVKQNKNGSWTIKYDVLHYSPDDIRQPVQDGVSRYTCDILHLSPGNLYVPAYDELANYPGYILCESGLTRKQIELLPNPSKDPNVEINILGTWLSAIDAVRQLYKMGFRNINIISRTGYLPTVKAEFSETLNLEWDKEKITSTSTAFAWLKETLASRLKKSKDEVETIFQNKLKKMEARRQNHRDVSESCLHHLEKEIMDASGKRRDWKEVMEFFYFKFQKLFLKLSEAETAEFFEKYADIWRVCQIGIPIASARDLQQYLAEGALKVKCGLKQVKPGNSKEEFIFDYHGQGPHSEEPHKAKFIIDATGPKKLTSKNIHRVPFIDKLVKKGVLVLHPNGGIIYNPETMHPIDKKGNEVKSMTVCGSMLTWGTSLNPSDIDIIDAQMGNIQYDLDLFSKDEAAAPNARTCPESLLFTHELSESISEEPSKGFNNSKSKLPSYEQSIFTQRPAVKRKLEELQEGSSSKFDLKAASAIETSMEMFQEGAGPYIVDHQVSEKQQAPCNVAPRACLLPIRQSPKARPLGVEYSPPCRSQISTVPDRSPLLSIRSS